MTGLINANPTVYERKERRPRTVPSSTNEDEYSPEAIDQLEVFDHIRDIKDPEHPYSLEELKVITEDAVEVNDKNSHVRVTFTPTVEHCSMATVIGLCIRVKLLRSLPSRYKVDITVAPGTHATEAAVNKQLNDKERVAAHGRKPQPCGDGGGLLLCAGGKPSFYIFQISGLNSNVLSFLLSIQPITLSKKNCQYLVRVSGFLGLITALFVE
ncbi:hypothetical protein IFM89_023940 [Coptis chinensis]|uniref:MIP18 family-like domain-containing protein n=1 Tax=Coptis chinensis TaxID=261450 RepID=A0A835I571_9MAGN|nr:hypothetical protein IFM89_023940 [Coptis chinensis]